jgi:hypothetical protein
MSYICATSDQYALSVSHFVLNDFSNWGLAETCLCFTPNGSGLLSHRRMETTVEKRIGEFEIGAFPSMLFLRDSTSIPQMRCASDRLRMTKT